MCSLLTEEAAIPLFYAQPEIQKEILNPQPLKR
jgi:hypothetical protein